MSSLQRALAAPVIFISFEKFGLGLAHLLSLISKWKPKVVFHLEIMLPTWFRIHMDGAYAYPRCPGKCWPAETSGLLIAACIYGLSSPLLSSSSYRDSGRQATPAWTVWHRGTGTFSLPSFIIIVIHFHYLDSFIDITSSDHCLPKWQPKHILNIIKIFIITKN